MIGKASYGATMARIYRMIDKIEGVAPPLSEEDIPGALEESVGRLIEKQEDYENQIFDLEEKITSLEEQADELRERIKQARDALG